MNIYILVNVIFIIITVLSLLYCRHRNKREKEQTKALQKELKSYSGDLERKIEEKTAEFIQLERHKFNLEKLATTGQLVAQLVHELRNPLSSIKMGLTTLQRRAVLSGHDEKIVGIALREVTHLERMMKELLAYAKPEALEFVQCGMNQVLELTLEKMHEQLQETHSTVTTQFDGKLPQIRLDIDRMCQVFANIIMNAQQASGENGHLLIRSSLLKGENKIRVEVRDFGKGIPPDQQSRIFEPFFSRKEGGTGLGLTVVKTIVEAHGGIVSVQSDVGKGTSMRVDLPVC